MLKKLLPTAFAILLASLSGRAQAHEGAEAPVATPTTVVEKTPSMINGTLSVVDISGFRFLVAETERRIDIQGSLDLKNHPRLVTPYTQMISIITAMHPSINEKGEQVFDMGLGGGTLPRFHLARYPKLEIDSAELDPLTISLAKKYFYVSNERHKILEGDGFETLEARKKKYDVIWMDEFTPKAGPRATIEAEYQKVLRDHLKPNGILIVHLGTSNSPKKFARTISDYHTGFTHGIRVQGPAQLTPTLAKMREMVLILTEKKMKTPPYHPDQVVAFTNGPSLSCARFWKVYEQWSKKRETDLKWSDSSRAQSCQELPE